jgi:co-chaperonin GroES (HSP10)
MKSKINFNPLADYVVCEWYLKEEKESEIILTGTAKKEEEAGLNGINEVLAVGPTVENIKVGDWAMLAHTEVPIVNIDGVPCAIYKAHMLMGTFDSKPDLETSKNSKEGPILRTKKTEKKARDFAKKYGQK